MRATIEIKEIKLDSINIYNSFNYGGDGFYLVTDELFNKSFIAVINTSVWYLLNSLPTFLNETEDLKELKQEERFSEEFILKLVAIAVNKENYKNVNAQPIKI